MDNTNQHFLKMNTLFFTEVIIFTSNLQISITEIKLKNEHAEIDVVILNVSFRLVSFFSPFNLNRFT